MRDNELLSLVEINHLLLSQLKNVEVAVDMTVGNGLDTEFLVNTFPKVIGFDLQADVLNEVKTRLNSPNLKLICSDHLLVDQYLTSADLFVFNLGWLPHSDKRIVTSGSTTIATLEKCQTLLNPGGIISIIVYRGNSHQEKEAEMVENWINNNSDFLYQKHYLPKIPTSPILYLLALKKSVR